MKYQIVTQSGKEYEIDNTVLNLSQLIDEINKISLHGFLVFDDVAVMKCDVSTIRRIR